MCVAGLRLITPLLSDPSYRTRSFAFHRFAPGAYSKASQTAAITSRGAAPSALKTATCEPFSLSRTRSASVGGS